MGSSSSQHLTRRAAIGVLVTAAAVTLGRHVLPKLETLVPSLPAPLSPGGRAIDRLTIHHTASPASVGGRRVDAALLGEWHRERGLGIGAGDERDCAYHFVVLPDGSVDAGRPLDSPSAGTRDLKNNRRSIDVVLVGDFEPAHNRGRFSPGRPTPAQLRRVNAIAVWASRTYGIDPDALQGHGEVTPGKTACPGQRLDLARMRTRLAASLERGLEAGPPPGA